MAPEDALFAITEVSIGLAGFSGLVAAFVQHEGKAWQRDQKARIVLLIVMSFGTIACALAPYALSGFTASPAIVWGIPMVTFSMLSMALLVHWVVLSRQYNFRLHFPWVSLPVLTAAVLLQIVNFCSGLGLVYPYSSALFVLGFLSVLVFGAIVFLALLESVWG